MDRQNKIVAAPVCTCPHKIFQYQQLQFLPPHGSFVCPPLVLPSSSIDHIHEKHVIIKSPMPASLLMVLGFPPMAMHSCLSSWEALLTILEMVFVPNLMHDTISVPMARGFLRAPPSCILFVFNARPMVDINIYLLSEMVSNNRIVTINKEYTNSTHLNTNRIIQSKDAHCLEIGQHLLNTHCMKQFIRCQHQCCRIDFRNLFYKFRSQQECQWLICLI